MARFLTKKQKTLLTKVSSVTPEVLHKLESINDYETLPQDAQRFHEDYTNHKWESRIYNVINPTQATMLDEDWIKYWR